jgi:hypothetical protein
VSEREAAASAAAEGNEAIPGAATPTDPDPLGPLAQAPSNKASKAGKRQRRMVAHVRHRQRGPQLTLVKPRVLVT